jgi:hypothetical protein
MKCEAAAEAQWEACVDRHLQVHAAQSATMHLHPGMPTLNTAGILPTSSSLVAFLLCLTACCFQVPTAGASSFAAGYMTQWNEAPAEPSLPSPHGASTSPSGPPVWTDLQSLYAASKEALALLAAVPPTSTVDIGANDWRAPSSTSPKAATARGIYDLIEAGRLSPSTQLTFVTANDGELVRTLGLGACNLAVGSSSAAPQQAAAAAAQRAPRSYTISVEDEGDDTDTILRPAMQQQQQQQQQLRQQSSLLQQLQQQQQQQRLMVPRAQAIELRSRTKSSPASAPLHSGLGAATGGRQRLLSKATAVAMQQALGFDDADDSAAAILSLGVGIEGRQQQQQQQQQAVAVEGGGGSRQVAVHLVADHLGLGGSNLCAADRARLAAVLDTVLTLADGGLVPRHVGFAQYACWVARHSDATGMWRAAVRCALAPLAGLQARS